MSLYCVMTVLFASHTDTCPPIHTHSLTHTHTHTHIRCRQTCAGGACASTDFTTTDAMQRTRVLHGGGMLAVSLSRTCSDRADGFMSWWTVAERQDHNQHSPLTSHRNDESERDTCQFFGKAVLSARARNDLLLEDMRAELSTTRIRAAAEAGKWHNKRRERER